MQLEMDEPIVVIVTPDVDEPSVVCLERDVGHHLEHIDAPRDKCHVEGAAMSMRLIEALGDCISRGLRQKMAGVDWTPDDDH